MHKVKSVWVVMVTAASVTAVGALLTASNIDPAHKQSWGENVGWLNWYDANAGDDGVYVGADFLSGYIWGENTGWINVGDGNGPYGNTDDTDYGVNILGNGDLDGYAWSENRGWINFGWAAGSGQPERARYDSGAQRFYGYAWSENDGWINLDDPIHYVSAVPTCTVHPWGDVNGDGYADIDDTLITLACFGGACSECFDGTVTTCDITPCEGDGFSDIDDTLGTLAAFGGASWCPDPCD